MCVASISHLRFLVATWVLDPFLLHLFMQDLPVTDLCTIRLALYQPSDVDPLGPLHGDSSI